MLRCDRSPVMLNLISSVDRLLPVREFQICNRKKHRSVVVPCMRAEQRSCYNNSLARDDSRSFVLLFGQNQLDLANIFLSRMNVRISLILSHAYCRIQFQEPERFRLITVVNVSEVRWSSEGSLAQGAME